MKKLLLPAIGLLASLLAAQAQYFTPGDLAVVRIGGTNSSGNGEYVTTTDDGNTVYIDEYTTNGTLVKSLPVPSSGPNALIESGEPYEGLMTIMPDQSHLVIIGYNTPFPYSSELIFSVNTTVPRIVATIDAYGNFSYPITNTAIFDSSYVCTCAASDGTNYWAIGTGPSTGFNQVAYLGTATAGTTTYIVTNLFNSGGRSINIFDITNSYQMFVTGYTSNETAGVMAGGFLCSNINGALPTTPTGTTNLFPSGLSSGSTQPYDLAINSTGTVAYEADEGQFGIIKFTNNTGLWVSNYTISMTNAGFQAAAGSARSLSLTVDWTQAEPVIYAVTAETYTNRLVSLTDTGTAAGANATVLTLAANVTNATGPNSGTNTFRGVRFVPLPVPEITSEPVSLTEVPGQTATFSATVLGIPTPTYQWYSNSVANPTFVAIPGATGTNFSLPSIDVSESGSRFYLIASNTYGTAQSAVVTLTVEDPAIITEPMGVTNFPGTGPVTLCATAVGTGTLTYQWLSNNVPIPGAQSSCYTVPNSIVSDTAAYSVIVSNALNESVTSSVTVVSYTAYLLSDTFSYPNGDLFGDAGSPWMEESGSNPIDVTNDRVQINQTIGALGTAFGQSLYSQPQSNAILWASFTVNLSTLPATPAGTYFAYFQSTNFNFYGRVIALTSNNPSYTPDISPVAAPGTYRLGIANDQTAASAVVELDMAPGIDYQVVAYYDMVNGFCQLAVNPSPTNYSEVYSPFAAPSPLASAITSDSFTPSSLPMAAYGLRQAANVGILQLDNLEVSADWNGAGSGYYAVTEGFSPALPVIGYLSPGITNYAGNSNALEVAASGIGLTYAWFNNGVQLTDGTNVSGSATPLLELSYLTGDNSGSYTVVVSNSAGAVTSAPIVVSVNTTPVAPIFTLQPVSVTSSLGATVTFTASAVGTGPITYQWNTDDVPNGATGTSYTLTRVTTNLSGTTYSVTATGGTGLSTTTTDAVLTVNGPVVTNIAFLRSLQVTNAAPTITVPASNSTTAYQVTGVVITYTNLESATYAEYWIEDSTAGIEFFVIDPTFRPHLGDVVTVTGVVDIFDDALELDGSANNPAEPYSIVSTNGENSPLPYPPELIPFGFATANPGLSSLKYQGSLGTFTNVYFTTPGAVITDEDTIEVTNKAGQIYYLYTGQSDGPDIIGQTLPAFAYSVTGAYDQFDAEYELNITQGSDIVTAPPPAVTNVTASVSGTNVTLTWTAVPANYTYSVWSTTNLLVPFAPLAPGLWFSNTSGIYTGVVSSNNQATFYEIVSP